MRAPWKGQAGELSCAAVTSSCWRQPHVVQQPLRMVESLLGIRTAITRRCFDRGIIQMLQQSFEQDGQCSDLSPQLGRRGAPRGTGGEERRNGGIPG